MQQNTGVVSDQDVIEPGDSALGRRVALVSISWMALAWFAVIALAAITRLVYWTAWPLSPSEASIATNALALVRGESITPEVLAQPMATALVALSMFLFGATDGAIRLVPALAGIGTILLLLGLGRWLGPRAMLGAAAIAAISPTMTFSARRVDGGGLLIFGSLLVLYCLLRWSNRPSSGWAVMVGFASAFLILSSPLGWVALLITLLAAWSIGAIKQGRQNGIGISSLAFLVTILVISTAFFSRPGGFAGFVSESLGMLWTNHLATVGERWFLVPYQIITDEPLTLFLVIYVLVTIVIRANRNAAHSDTAIAARGIALWAGVAILVALLLGGKAGELYSLVVLPLVLLAGYGLSHMMRQINWRAFTTGTGVAFIIALFLALAAGTSLLGMITGDESADAFNWIARFLILGLLILAPLATLTIWLGKRLPTPVAPIIGLVAVILLSAIVMRSSVLLGSTALDRSGQILTAGSTTAGVTEMYERLDRLSRDLTTFATDVRDPTGGHGLSITIDESIEQPFRWYFRDYPNLVVIDPDLAIGEQAFPQVVFAHRDHADALITDGMNYQQRSYPLTVTIPNTLADPNWGNLAQAIVNPYEWRRFGSYLLDRQTEQPADPSSYVLGLREDVAPLIYGTLPSE